MSEEELAELAELLPEEERGEAEVEAAPSELSELKLTELTEMYGKWLNYLERASMLLMPADELEKIRTVLSAIATEARKRVGNKI